MSPQNIKTSIESVPAPVDQRKARVLRIFWQGKIAPAFWTIAGIFSIVLNMILIIALILVGRQLFALKSLVQEGLINGLYSNFLLMDKAHIITTIEVKDTIQVIDQIQVVDRIPVVFDLPLRQETVVNLVQDTSIPNTIVYLNGIAIPTTVVLPSGTPLNITLDLTVPVSQTIPVVLNVPVALDVPISLTVPVDIPLDQTELHEPFVGLQDVVYPYRRYLGELPNAWEKTPFCGKSTYKLCKWLFDLK